MADVEVVAVAAGASGNLISLNIVEMGAFTVLSCVVTGNAIVVNVATDVNSFCTSTCLDVVNIINATPAAAALVTATTSTPASLAPFANLVEFLSGGSGGATGGGYLGQDLGNFKILLLDQNRVQVSNVPLLFANFFHVPDNAATISTQSNALAIPKHFWPTPPMTYRVNSSIQFYVYMTSATPLGAPVNFEVVFSGIRRYPCK